LAPTFSASDLARMAEKVGANALERQVNEVLDMLDTTPNGRVKQSVIARRLKLSAQDANILFQTMRYRDLIDLEKTPDGNPFWVKK